MSCLCLLHSDDFVTTFFVGFSNDSQTWVMYTNGYEEMVGARELLVVVMFGPGRTPGRGGLRHRGLLLSRPSTAMWIRTHPC